MYRGYVVVDKKGEWQGRIFGSSKAAHEFWFNRLKNLSEEEISGKHPFAVVEINVCE